MSSKIIIKVESSLEQQENLKNSRKCLKVLQKASGDKENLVGPKFAGFPQKSFIKSKSENELNDTEAKRKKLVTHAVQTDPELLELAKISEADLTTDGEPSEGYWKVLAEKRRIAIELTLKENAELHEERDNLADLLDVSNQMLDESRNLVEILTEMLDENETADDAASAGFELGESSRSVLMTASIAEEATERDDDDRSNCSSPSRTPPHTTSCATDAPEDEAPTGAD